MSSASIERPEFGTDGLRGRAGDPPLDPETLRRIGAALGIWLQREGPDKKRVLIGDDGRDSSSWILECLAQGLAIAETSTVDVGLTTTPALAWIARTQPFAAGIMISASHNPASDNGIKVFTGAGTKLPDAAQDAIADLAPKLDLGAIGRPRTKPQPELLAQYQEFLANTFAGLSLDGVTVVVDAANGGGAELGPSTLRALGADVVAVACEPDGWNINDGCGALHPESLRDVVAASGAALGICLDGDGDRGIFVDDRGVIRDGEDILLTLGVRLLERGELPHATVVTTVMANLGLLKALRDRGITAEITPVGDRNVTARMVEGGFGLGAETSGHVLFAGAGGLTGDGLFTALQLLSIPGLTTEGSAAKFIDFERFPQVLINVPVERKPALESIAPVMECRQRIETALGADGRVVLRYSGTENLCRVMIEGPERAAVDAFAAELANVVERELT